MANSSSLQMTGPATHGKFWTGQTLSSVEKYFPKLPAEIRLRIWGNAYDALEPRLIELEPVPRRDQIITRHKAPALLQVCRDSRFEGLKIYETLGAPPRYIYHPGSGWGLNVQNQHVFAPTFVGFAVDTIIFGHESIANWRATQLIPKGMYIKHEKIRKLGTHYFGCQYGNTFNLEIRKCTVLESFIWSLMTMRLMVDSQALVNDGTGQK